MGPSERRTGAPPTRPEPPNYPGFAWNSPLSRLKREPQLDVDSALVAGNRFRAEPAADAGGVQKKWRRDHADWRAQIFMVQSIARHDGQRQVITMFRSFAADTT